MWDSPGLSDPRTDERLTLKDIVDNCRDVDIFVYCTPIIQTRLGQDDLDSIRSLTQALGDDIWKKGLIALTFANEIRVPPSSHDSLEYGGWIVSKVQSVFWRRVTSLRRGVVSTGGGTFQLEDTSFCGGVHFDLEEGV